MRRARGTVLAVVLVVAAVGSACSDDSEKAASTSTSRAGASTTSTSTSVPPTTAALVATEGDLSGCDRTVEPYFRRPVNEGLAPGPGFLEGESLLFSGTREFPAYPANPSAFWGDLNGDGTADTLADDDDGIVVIPGPRPPDGDLSAAGVRLTGTFRNSSHVVPVGDQNGDGAADVSFDGRLVSGRALLSKPPGSSMPIPEAFAEVPYVITALQLEPGAPPVLAQVFGAPGPSVGADEPIQVKLGSTCLVTGTPVVDPKLDGSRSRSSGTISLDAASLDGHRHVEWQYVNRNTLVVFRWDLDDV